MLSDADLAQRFDDLGVPELGRARIRHIRANLPARVVRSNKASGKTRYTPIKMPFVIEAEAVSTEYVAAVEWDHDDETDEFYAQVEPLKISYLGQDSTRKTTIHTTPDFLRITASAFTFVECKTEETLKQLCKQAPNRYQLGADGRWRSPPAEQAAAAFGCLFEIRSSAENNWKLHENLELLKDYALLDSGDSPETDEFLQRLAREGWLNIDALVHEEGFSADLIYTLIQQRKVYFPLCEQRLSDQERAYAFRDETTYRAHVALHLPNAGTGTSNLSVTLEPGAVFDWNGATWQVINLGEKYITIQCIDNANSKSSIAELTVEQFDQLVRLGRIAPHQQADGVAAGPYDLLRRATPEQLSEALQRLAIIDGSSESSGALASRSVRTKKYWKAKFREAEVKYGIGLVGLLPNRNGNRTPRASAETLALAEEVITADWETIRHKRRSTSHGAYIALAKDKGLTPISYVTFCKLVKQRGGHRQLVTRVGEKAAYEDEPYYLSLEWTTPRHGVRPWHIAHIDHTPLPLKFVHSVLGTLVSTIWLTILIDAFSRKVLAYYLTFDPPSHRSCMMVLRDCVRRHNRVPQIVVSDQGSEFGSVYWETLLALLHVTKRDRKAGKPRDGSICERIFNTSQSQFVKNLLGSTDLVEAHFRRISPEVDPARHAIWTMDRFDSGFERYLGEVYHENHHAGLGMSPNAAWALGLKSHGARNHRRIPYDSNFVAQTCPAVQRGTAKVTAAGIKAKYRWYQCEEFAMPGVLGTNVPARYDPFNGGVAYALVKRVWRICYSEFHAVFSAYTERAIKLATERLRLSDRLSGCQAPINAERLARFLQEQEEDEELARQRTNDAEAAGHRGKIVPAAAEHVTPVRPTNSPPSQPRRALDLRELEDL